MNMPISTPLLYILAIFGLFNIGTFLVMLADKTKSATPGSPRIPEGLLFFLAAAFGGAGIFAGMFAFRHKTKKWYFLAGIPLLILENAAVIYLAYLLLGR